MANATAGLTNTTTQISQKLKELDAPDLDQKMRQDRMKEVSQLRRRAAQQFGQEHLGGAIPRAGLVHHDGRELIAPGLLTKKFVSAVASVQDLSLDHVVLFMKNRKPFAVVTMPYDADPDFVREGENDVVTWTSPDGLSWWYPGWTKLTVVVPKSFSTLTNSQAA